MIPKSMDTFLRKVISDRTWQNRLMCEDGLCYMEFYGVDVERLSRIGIKVDQLGPKLVACIWDDDPELEVGGYLIVDNLAMGRPAIGGIRMQADLNPAEIFYRARGMPLKNAAANLPFGGGKAGLLADPNLEKSKRQETLRRFARLLVRYSDIFLPGPDVGTHTPDMKIVAAQNGLDLALSKPEDMGGNRLDELGAAGGGLVIALESLLQELPRLRTLPQFASLIIPEPDQLTVMIQGFGSVGANTAKQISEQLPYARVIGISDTTGYLFNDFGLSINQLYDFLKTKDQTCFNYFSNNFSASKDNQLKYGSNGDDLLRESAYCFIPASPTSNYLDTESNANPSITIDEMGKWSLIIEGANTYSPDPSTKNNRERMERAVYRDRGILIATDYLVNSGSVIYAAQEQLIPTPSHLQIPPEYLGDEKKVNEWLKKFETEFQDLAQKRRLAAQKQRNEIIQLNMHELIDLLISDTDMLPSEAAERLSIKRIISREKQRTAADIMFPAIMIPVSSSIHDAADVLIETGSSLLVIVNANDQLEGVITQWDITKAAADGLDLNSSVQNIMSKLVISVSMNDSLVEVVRKLEYYEISAIPVLRENMVLGLISTDHLTRRSLLPLLIDQYN